MGIWNPVRERELGMDVVKTKLIVIAIFVAHSVLLLIQS